MLLSVVEGRQNRGRPVDGTRAGGIPMRNRRSSAERLGRLIVGLAVALGVLVATPLSAGHRMPWLLSLGIDRAEGGVGSGPPFFSPTDLAVEASEFLVVVDTHLAAVPRVDPVSGDRTIVSD